MAVLVRRWWRTVLVIGRHPSSVLCVGALLAACVTQVRLDASGAPYDYGLLSGVVSGLSALGWAMPLAVVALTVYWAGTQASDAFRASLHLSGDSWTRSSSTSLVAITVLVSMGGVLACALAGMAGLVWGEPAPDGPMGLPALEGPSFSGWAVAVPVVAFGWGVIALGLCGLGRGLASAAGLASLLLLISFLVQRLAVTNATLLHLHSLSPLGASTTLLAGRSVPAYPPSNASHGTGAILLICWAAGFALIAFASSGGGVLPSARIRSRHAARVVAALGVAGLLVLVGFTLPSRMADGIPWSLQGRWREMKAQDDTPAATVRDVVMATRSGRTLPEMSFTSAALRDYGRVSARIRDASSVHAFDLEDEPAPGSVALDVGRQEASADGAVVPPQQFGFCLHRSRGEWVVVFVSDAGVACVGMPPDRLEGFSS